MPSRRARTAIALFCVVAQLALGASALGLVVCTGRDHAGIELASDDCCAPHGSAARPAPPGAALEDRCCSDAPLFSAGRRVSDVPRPSARPARALLAVVAPPAPAAVAGEWEPARARSLPPSRRALGSIVFRI